MMRGRCAARASRASRSRRLRSSCAIAGDDDRARARASTSGDRSRRESGVRTVLHVSLITGATRFWSTRVTCSRTCVIHNRSRTVRTRRRNTAVLIVVDRRYHVHRGCGMGRRATRVPVPPRIRDARRDDACVRMMDNTIIHAARFINDTPRGERRSTHSHAANEGASTLVVIHADGSVLVSDTATSRHTSRRARTRRYLTQGCASVFTMRW
jgi:hypothetical protein